MELTMEGKKVQTEEKGGNTLFPVFVKLEQLRLLIVGGGNVCLEKLQAVLQNSPATTITIVAPEIAAPVRELAEKHPNILLLQRPYHRCDLEGADIAIVAVHRRADLHRSLHVSGHKVYAGAAGSGGAAQRGCAV